MVQYYPLNIFNIKLFPNIGILEAVQLQFSVTWCVCVLYQNILKDYFNHVLQHLMQGDLFQATDPFHVLIREVHVLFTHTMQFKHSVILGNLPSILTKPVIINHLSKNNYRLFCLYSIITIYTTTTKSSSLLQKLMGILLQLTEMGYYILNRRYQ